MRMRKRRNDEHNSPIRNNTWRPFVLLFFKKIIFCRFLAKNHYLCMVWWWVKRNCPNWLLHATKFSFFFFSYFGSGPILLRPAAETNLWIWKKKILFLRQWLVFTNWILQTWLEQLHHICFFFHTSECGTLWLKIKRT